MQQPSQSNRLTTFVVAIFVASVCVVSAADAGTVYTWRDDGGVAQYADTCPAGVECQQARLGFGDNVLESTAATVDSDSHAGNDAVGVVQTVMTGSHNGRASSVRPGEDDISPADPSGGAARTGNTVTAIVSWGAAKDKKVRGYRVYYGVAGTEHSAPGTEIDVGNRITHTVNGLRGGIDYYFMVKAVDSSGAVLAVSVPAYASIP